MPGTRWISIGPHCIIAILFIEMAKRKGRIPENGTAALKEEKKPRARRKRMPVPIDVDGKSLIIVESPAKAKTINKYLGHDYVVEASVGHINMDLFPSMRRSRARTKS